MRTRPILRQQTLTELSRYTEILLCWKKGSNIYLLDVGTEDVLVKITCLGATNKYFLRAG
jgi:hypothetical protein